MKFYTQTLRLAALLTLTDTVAALGLCCKVQLPRQTSAPHRARENEITT